MSDSRDKYLNMKKLEGALDVFSKLHSSSIHVDSLAIPSEYEKHLLVASYAIGILDSLGEEKLKELEFHRIIHGSTISGSSLLIARDCIENYVDGQKMFTRDDYEQLYRACNSTIQLFKHNILK